MKAIGRIGAVLITLCVLGSGVATAMITPEQALKEAEQRVLQLEAENDRLEAELSTQQGLTDVATLHQDPGAKRAAEEQVARLRPRLAASKKALARAKEELTSRRRLEEPMRRALVDPYSGAVRYVLLSRQKGGPQPTLVIPSGKMEASDLDSIVEDMTIMGRILDKELEREFGKDYQRLSSTGPFSFASSPGVPQNIYLDGYGAVFLVGVTFPLVPPQVIEEPKEEEQPQSTWDQAKREVFGQRESLTTRTGRPTFIGLPGGLGGQTPPAGREFDPAKVEGLRQTLFGALKEASNMRGLKPDDSIAVAVFGGAAASVTVRGIRGAFGGGGFGGEGGFRSDPAMPGFGMSTTFVSPRVMTSTAPTVLTIHVTKSDVDAFAKGELSEEEFGKRAAITATAYGAASPEAYISGAMPDMLPMGFGEMPPPLQPRRRR